MHCNLLPLLSNCLPLLDEICRRSLKFTHACVSSGIDLVRYVALYGVQYARGFSFLGRTASFCVSRYNVALADILSGEFVNPIRAYVRRLYDSDTSAHADLLAETLKIIEGLFDLPRYQQSLTRNDLEELINFVCAEKVFFCFHLCIYCIYSVLCVRHYNK